jgi:hypothetical protein
LTSLPIKGQENGCQVQDASELVDTDTCGSREYNLGVSYDGGVRAEYEDQWAYGACDGGYLNCDNQYVEQGYIRGGEYFHDDGPVGYGEEYVHWTLDDWIVTLQSCHNAYPSDETQTENDYPYDTSEFDVDCGE